MQSVRVEQIAWDDLASRMEEILIVTVLSLVIVLLCLPYLFLFLLHKRTKQLDSELKALRSRVLETEDADKTSEVSEDRVAATQSEQLSAKIPTGFDPSQPQPTRQRQAFNFRKWLPSRPKNDPFAFFKRVPWMIWVGGCAVSIAGVLLARYGIEQGVLGPEVRVVAALVTGVSLHGCAEYLRRRFGAHPSFAALSGGASITLFATTLIALDIFALSPMVVFAALALIALGTMALALLHGPLLAALGLIGAYLVPILVSTGKSTIDPALIYAAIITCASLVLLRQVYRTWLNIGVLIGAFGWWCLSWASTPVFPITRELYLFFTLWAFVALPTGNWLLKNAWVDAGRLKEGLIAFGPALALITLGFFIQLRFSTFELSTLWVHALIPLIWCHLAYKDTRLAPAVLTVMLGSYISLLLRHFEDAWIWADYWISTSSFPQYTAASVIDPIETQLMSLVLTTLAAVFTGFGALRVLRGLRFEVKVPCARINWIPDLFWVALAAFSAPLALGSAYVINTDLSADLNWALAGALMGTVYLALGAKLVQQMNASMGLRDTGLIFALAGHLSVLLGITLFFREAGLTLACAVMLTPLVLTHQKTQDHIIPMIIKGILALIGIRLTILPWSNEALVLIDSGVNSVITYAGATLACFGAAFIARTNIDLSRWLQGAALTLTILTLNVLVREWLYEAGTFNTDYTFIESVINTLLWGGAGLVYYWRAQLSQHLKKLYEWLAMGLLSLSLINHLLITLLLENPLLNLRVVVSETAIWNELLPAYGLPVALMAAALYLYQPLRANSRIWKAALATCGLSALYFVSIEIRHIWTPEFHLRHESSHAEVVTYSAVWLMIATLGILWAIKRHSKSLYRIALSFLGLVTVKIFFVDMGELEGLTRIASFMGLGLVLLALGWLHQRMSKHWSDLAG